MDKLVIIIDNQEQYERFLQVFEGVEPAGARGLDREAFLGGFSFWLEDSDGKHIEKDDLSNIVRVSD